MKAAKCSAPSAALARKNKAAAMTGTSLPAEFLMENDRFVADLVLSQEVSFLSNTLIPERSKLAWLEGK